MLRYSQLICLAVVAVAVAAYDFKDTDFNEYLFEQLEADNDYLTQSRSRREVDVDAGQQKECSRRDWKKDLQCCESDKVDHDQTEPFKEIKKQCNKEIRGNSSDDAFDPFDCEKMQQIKQQIVCISECVSKKLNILDENGALKREAVLTQLGSVKKIGETQWKKDGLEGFVDKCLKEVNEKNKPNAGKQTAGCNSAPLELQHCIWREFVNGCPEKLRVDTPKCNKMRTRLANGDETLWNKHLVHAFHHYGRHEE